MKCLVYIQSGFDVYHSWIILTTDNVHCSLSWLTGHCLVAAAGPGIILSPSSATPLGSQFIPFPVSAAPDHCLLLFIEFVFVQFLPLSDETGLSETETKRRCRAQPWLGAGWYDLTPASLLMKHWDQARSGDSLCITQRGKGGSSFTLYLVYWRYQYFTEILTALALAASMTLDSSNFLQTLAQWEMREVRDRTIFRIVEIPSNIIPCCIFWSLRL